MSKDTGRKKISDSIRQAILLESGYKCANPNCRHILTLEIHHIIWVKDGGGNNQSNLIALCPNCHALHTRGNIPMHAILTWKSLLVSLNNPNRESVDLLLVLYEEEQLIDQSDKEIPTFHFTGDGLGFLSGLIISGLIEISQRSTGITAMGSRMPSFRVRLTTTGRQLVEAWKNGTPDAVRSVLESSDKPAGLE